LNYKSESPPCRRGFDSERFKLERTYGLKACKLPSKL